MKIINWLVLGCVATASLVGCATKQEYAFRATRPNLDFDRDKYECLERAQIFKNIDMYYSCMAARGWKKVPKNTPPSDAAPNQGVQSQNQDAGSNWVQYYASNQADFFYDKSSMWRNSSVVKVTDSKRYSSYQTRQDGKLVFNQVQMRHSIDCKRGQGRIESIQYVDSGRDGSRIVLDAGGDDAPRNIPKGSPVYELAMAVCK